MDNESKPRRPIDIGKALFPRRPIIQTEPPLTARELATGVIIAVAVFAASVFIAALVSALGAGTL